LSDAADAAKGFYLPPNTTYWARTIGSRRPATGVLGKPQLGSFAIGSCQMIFVQSGAGAGF
jgi:hypothetical protein